jgi:hypothetical protein
MTQLRKNKPKNKTTMLDFIKENQTDNPLVKQTAIAQSNIHAFKYTDQYMEQVLSYNKNLTQIDPLYESVKPLHEILVRFYLHEPQKVGSLVMPFKQNIPVPNKSGQGEKYSEIESDFPYRLTAVVVSAPESNTLKAGDKVLLSRRAIQLTVVGQGANANLIVNEGFVHPDSMMHECPTDVTSQHYGYGLVQYHEIKAIL